MSDLTPDRERYIRDNAVALVDSLQAQVHRQRAELARLNQRREHLTAERDRLRKSLLFALRLACTLHDLPPEDEAWAALREIEAEARQALAASGVSCD